MRWVRFAAIGLSLALAPAAWTAEAAPSPTPLEVDDQPLDIPIMTGGDVQGLKIPQYGPNGQLQMQFAAEVARKLDDKTLEFENLKIDVADEKGMVEVEIPKSKFDLESRVLKGDAGTKIKRQDFEITGETVEFHVRSRFSRLGGNVKMIIYSLDAVKDE